jgi:hypothetical protein
VDSIRDERPAVPRLPSLLIPLRGPSPLGLGAQSAFNGAERLVITLSTSTMLPYPSSLRRSMAAPSILVISGSGQRICGLPQRVNAAFGAQSERPMTEPGRPVATGPYLRTQDREVHRSGTVTLTPDAANMLRHHKIVRTGVTLHDTPLGVGEHTLVTGLLTTVPPAGGAAAKSGRVPARSLTSLAFSECGVVSHVR